MNSRLRALRGTAGSKIFDSFTLNSPRRPFGGGGTHRAGHPFCNFVEQHLNYKITGMITEGSACPFPATLF